MGMVTIPAETFAQLARWHRALGPTGTAVCADGRMLLTGGAVGVEFPLAGLDGCSFATARVFDPLTTLASDVSIAYTAGSPVVVESGGFRARVPILADEGRPHWPVPVVKASGWRTVDPAWWEAVQAVAFALPKKLVAGGALDGVAWRGKQVVAGDGVWVARAAVGTEGTGFVPAKLLGLGQEAPAPPEAVAWEGTDRAWLRFPGGVLAWAVLPTEPWPDAVLTAVAEFAKQAGKSVWASWDGPTARAAVERVASFGAGRGLERITWQALKRGQLVFSTESATGSAREVVPATVATAFDVDANARLLAEGVGRAPACALAVERGAALFRRPGFELALMLMNR